jgi:hypothetical protein
MGNEPYLDEMELAALDAAASDARHFDDALRGLTVRACRELRAHRAAAAEAPQQKTRRRKKKA